MQSPIVGVTTFHSQPTGKTFRYISVTEAYVHALVQAGAIPVMVPLGLPAPALDALFPILDGLLFTGGGDLHPDTYAGNGSPFIENVDPERDRVELHLARQAADQGKPFLGICRGLQVVNVALGGNLYADIRAEQPGTLKHDCFEQGPRQRLAHAVDMTVGSRLAELLGSGQIWVNSGHHQAIHELGAGLQVSARAPDGIIEAVELGTHPFGLAVQWHPEWLTHLAPMLTLFERFVAAARGQVEPI
jgi:putative glutamine amidotransferase